MPRPVLLDVSALADARRSAGIGRYVEELAAALGRLEELHVHRHLPPRPPHESWVARYAWNQPFLAAAYRRGRPALVHGMAGEASLVVPPRRQVVTVHDIFPWEDRAARDPVTREYLRLQRGLLARCAALLAVSRATADALVHDLGVGPERVHVVPEGVGAAFRPGRGEPPAGLARRGYLAWAGSMRAHDPRKALDSLVEAAAAGELPLVLAGRTGTESERLAKSAARLGVDVRLTGFLPDPELAQLYEHAAAVVFPSLREGFGLPVLEALASGALVVATRTGAIPDFATGAAILVPPGDGAALTDAVRRAMAAGADVVALREAAAGSASGYTWERTARATAEIYRRLLTEPAG
ncbi:MAG: glycosyltransferase family 4 protein [Candidatus Dormibacteria bacterium]